MKTIERAHSPAHMWERIKLSNNYTKALEQVRLHAPPISPPLTPITLDRQRTHPLAQFYHPQMQTARHQDHSIPDQDETPQNARAVRTQLLTKDCTFIWFLRPKLVGVKKKLDRREAVRERKALSAAHLERAIEKELLERLKSKAYGDAPLNVNESVWQAILDKEKAKDRSEKVQKDELDMVAEETDEEDEELEEEMEEEWDDREFVSDISGDEDDGLSDLEEAGVWGSSASMLPQLTRLFHSQAELDGSDESSEDDTSHARTNGKAALGKRKSEFGQRKPKRALILRLPFLSQLFTVSIYLGAARIEVEYENETETIPTRTRAVAGW